MSTSHKKTSPVDLIPPAMIAVVLLFWAFAPKAILDNPWTLVVTSPLIVIVVLLLEFVFERHEGWRINRQEFLTDLYYSVLSATVISWLTQKLAEDPLLAVKSSLGITTQWAAQMPWLAQVALVIFLIEFGQYWMHRLMHNSTPFWLTHAPHHHITQLNAAKGAVGNPIELFLISLSVVALFDLDKTAIFAALNTTGVISTFAHANVRANPPIWYSFFFTTIRHHSLHHSTDYESTRCNYGNSLILLDRIFGTYREGEGVLVGQDDRRRLSILEQTLFPFQPLIDRFKARRRERDGAAGDAGGPAAA
ncbi:Sterol desaturase-like protein [Novosphingobium aromaticivorans DSM 12444]|uniref:Sterol desaturase-like protein n=1 Tax=Novosphingobium aromaticivorans (strain ATCC 700278 / DSM 12444 / CCUG 56034 / CIP 105152 / NBRC 16084 / F199) TaxID=279238 RepID=Q2GAS6_NOVAD|nr:sterol desaturase family protein [Novosphingobium aromaticivorans]ABD25047.1 Sterol desaturase-like protein [Novosphingobium aromaticivorans DSM 12444]SCY87227.1 Fatty acid hydroxylase superfamily protein [Novosphingobium aromaticivorans]